MNLDDITDIDYRPVKRVLKEFNIKNRGAYDWYVQSDTLLLADVFEHFRNTSFKKFKLDSEHFLSAPGLIWLSYLQKTGIKPELLTYIDMLLMVEEGIRRGINHAGHSYTKAINKYMKKYEKNYKNKESSYIQYFGANYLYGWSMAGKLPVDYFKWKKKYW